RGRGRRNSMSCPRCTAGIAAPSLTATIRAATFDYVVATDRQGFLRLVANVFVAVAQRTRQGSDEFWRAAATAVFEEVANFVGGFGADLFGRVVQRVDQRDHDLRMATAIEVAE